MSRQLIVVDVETSGLADHRHILEVAAINVATGEELYFVPDAEPEVFKWAEPAALAINRYFERRVWESMLSDEETLACYRRLALMLADNTFGGSNPRFDAKFLAKKTGEVWHHRLADLAAYAGPAMLLAPNELVGMAQVCERLGVTIDGEHSALGDARATAECFRKLTAHYGKTMEPVK